MTISRATPPPSAAFPGGSGWTLVDRIGGLWIRGRTWVRVIGRSAFLGLTPEAADELGPIVAVRLAAVGARLRPGDPACVIRTGEHEEPVEMPLAGRVVEANQRACARPSLVRADPFGDGWLLRVRLGED